MTFYLLQEVSMVIRGEKQVVRGGILFALADTLAAHSIGGFKVGVDFALHQCWMYLASGEDLATKVCVST